MKIPLGTLLLSLSVLTIGCLDPPKPKETPTWRPTTITARTVLEKMPAALEQFKQSRGGQLPTDLMQIGYGMHDTCVTCRTHPQIQGYVFYYRYDNCWKVEAMPRGEKTAPTLIVDCTGVVREE